jgi:hypothetical protein
MSKGDMQMRHYEIVNAGYGSEGDLVPGKLSNEKDPKRVILNQKLI